MLLQATLRRSKVLASAAAALQVHMPVEQQQLAPAGARSLHLESVQQICNLVSKRIPTSPWALQYSSSAQSESAVANGSESELVEEWLLQLSQMPFWSRTYAEALLSRNPELLYLQDSSRITETVQVLADAIHDRALMRPWFFADKVVLQLVERYSPEALRARLAQLHTDVWSRLDDDSVGALACQLRTCNRRMAGTDLLDLDARALAAKAHKLRMLAPHIAPSMLFRAVPELADVEPEEVPRLVQGVGKVVAVLHPSVAKRIAFRVQADNTITVVALQPRASVAAAAQQLPMALFATTAEPQALATAGSSNGALSWHSYGASSHNAGCGTSSTATLLPLVPTMTLRAAAMGRGTSCDDGWMYESDDSTREQPGCVIATLSNVISVVYVGPLLELDVRHTQPDATSACSTTTAESASVVAASAAYSKKQQEVIHSRQASSSRHVHHDNINHDATESVQSVYSTYPMAAMA